MEILESFGFGENDPRPCSPDRLRYASAVIGMFDAAYALEKAKTEVPDYTGQWSSSDYYAREQEAYYRAADELADATLQLERPE